MASPTSVATGQTAITVLYFASASTCTAKHSERLGLPTSPSPFSLAMLSQLLGEKYAGMKAILDSSAWSVEEEMVSTDDIDKVFLNGGEVVAVIPPVSGG